MNRPIRLALLVTGLILAVFTAGFILQAPWATGVWPFESGRLSNLFVASILAAIAAPILWISQSGELRAMAGGAINLAVTTAGFSLVTFQAYAASRQPGQLAFGILSLGILTLTVVLFLFSRRLHFQEGRRLPGLVRASFILFSAVLLLAGSALVLKRPNVFPWPISAENSLMYGWIFLGAMCYFIYALVFPNWGNARGQLLGFLAYDLVLIGPFIALLSNVAPGIRAGLLVYIGVLLYSGLVAAYFLFIHPPTRFRLSGRETAPLTPQP